MTAKDRKAEERQALQCLLDTVGADRTRWPARERLRFASLLSEDGAAQRMLAEAAAFDALLDCAPQPSEEREQALKERIVAAALQTTGTRLTVVATESSDKTASQRNLASRLVTLTNAVSSQPVPMRREWPAAAVLAASLVIGVMLGSSGTFDSTAQQMAAATGFTTATAGETSRLALLDDEIVAMVDEDFL